MQQQTKKRHNNYVERYVMTMVNEGRHFQDSEEFEILLNDIKSDCLNYFEDSDCQNAVNEIENYILKYGIENFENLHMILKLLKGTTSMEAIYYWLISDKKKLEEILPNEVNSEEITLMNNYVSTQGPLERAIEICELYHVNRSRARHLKEFWEKKNNLNCFVKEDHQDVNCKYIAIMALNDYQEGMYIQDIVVSWDLHCYSKQIIDEALKIMTDLNENVGQLFTKYYEAHYEYLFEEKQAIKRRCFRLK